MRIVIPVITALLAGVLVFWFMKRQESTFSAHQQTEQIDLARMSVEKSLDRVISQTETRLKAFTEALINDRNFSIKLLVENDRSSPEVAAVAARFMKPMGFSILEVIDSSKVIVSSGHFPASVGNTTQFKDQNQSGKIAVVEDNVQGNLVLTLQGYIAFTIAEIPFVARGGHSIDDAFLEQLSPNNQVSVYLKWGERIIGRQDVRSISPLKNGKIILNDKTYSGASIPLPVSEGSPSAELLVLVE